MPGISFLFKKKFHPSRIDNQKRVYIAEEENNERLKRERERAEEVKKEQNLFDEISSSAREENQVSFLYNVPNQLKQSMMAKNAEQSQKALSVARHRGHRILSELTRLVQRVEVQQRTFAVA